MRPSGLLGINIDKRFTDHVRHCGGRRGTGGRYVWADPRAELSHGNGLPRPFSFVVVVVGGMGSLPGAVAAGFLLGILQSFASMNEVKAIILPGIDQIIIYLVAIIVLLTASARPDGAQRRHGGVIICWVFPTRKTLTLLIIVIAASRSARRSC